MSYNPYNPYGVPHPEYYNPYSDNPQVGYPPPQTQPTTGNNPRVTVAPVRRESSGFEQGEFTPTPMAPPGGKSRTVRALRDYRYGQQGNLCTKGGRVRCIGRICCCSLMTTVFLIVSIVLALALWVRPPSIIIGSVQPLSSNGSEIQTTSNGLSVSLGVGIAVSNPNYFSVDFKKIEAEIFYPINNTAVGGGSDKNIVFKANSQTNFTFPFTLSYNASEDTSGAIISDLASKCGAKGGTTSDLVINYKINLSIRIILVTISPVISNQFKFPCPISGSEIAQLLGGKI